MGYNFYITKRQNWFDEDGLSIEGEELREIVSTDSELDFAEDELTDADEIIIVWKRNSLNVPMVLSDGIICVKNPDENCLAKMKLVANLLAARVQDEDGDFYGDETATDSQTWAGRLKMFYWSVKQDLTRRPASTVELPFGVGDRVRDVLGNELIVEEIDHSAEHGLGTILTRRCHDDAAEKWMMAAHGLVRLEGREK